MKFPALNQFRRRLAADTPLFGLRVTLESPGVTEVAVALGLDWVVIDAEHGHLDWQEIAGHLRATARSDTVALVRVAELNGGLVKRALDLGADGVVIPWVETPEQLRQAVALTRYPPEGQRGIGGERATLWGLGLAEYTAAANEQLLVVPILETVKAAANVAALSQVAGAELYFFGPADFSASAGHRGQWEGPGVAEQLLGMKDVLRRAGKHCGVQTTGTEDLHRRLRQGFRVLGLGMDVGLLIRSLRGALAAVGRDRGLQLEGPAEASEQPGEVSQAMRLTPPLPRPPEAMRPDRPEVMTAPGAAPPAEIAAGVRFDCLAGARQGARNLTTGLVTFEPGAELSYHRHPFAESITLVQGQAAVEVEGRCYDLASLDNVTIPRGRAHAARNTSPVLPAVLYVALAAHEPTRELVQDEFRPRRMAASSTGTPGGERVTRFRAADRFPAGPQTTFLDFCNADLLPGLELSGGYGLFRPGGRLPAHLHDFDESICIIQGSAACVVEGRRHALAGDATALVPRGRVHYFRNESEAPMAMLWFYAWPRPERIVVDEGCATAEGNPWR
jgi:2-dehydro-3-deoxyglucarate aldolase/4-hydroxy-2-oxoheptanedioate aldolase